MNAPASNGTGYLFAHVTQNPRKNALLNRHKMKEVRNYENDDSQRTRRELNTIQAENQKLQQQNSELQKQVEELQADRKWNQDSLKMLVEARSKSNKQLKGINSAIKQKQHELEAIKGDLEEVKDYLTEGQQNRLAEIDREWNDFELE